MIYAGVDTSSLTEDEVLFFIRIKGKKHFFDKIYSRPVINQLFGHISNYRTISEYPNADYYIDLSKRSILDFRHKDFETYNSCIKPNISSIIFRCRGLRAISFEESKDLILRATKYWIDFFENNTTYKVVVIHIIDNYVLDILYRVASHYKVKILVLSEFFIYGYRRHTIYGEYVKNREVELEEIDEVLPYFTRKEKSFWLNGVTIKTSLKYCSYLYLSYYARLVLRYFIGYKILGNISYEFRFSNILGKISVRNFFIGKYFTAINTSQIITQYNDAVYIPLHVYPEANVDYWITDYNDADYYNSIYEALVYFKEKNVIVYIKEHPGFLFQRDIDFYKKITSFKNVHLIHPFDKNVDLINNIQNILIWHGSAGVEGVMQNKKVVVFEENYYSKNFITNLNNYDLRRTFSDKEKKEFISDILSGVEKFKME